MLKSLPEMSPAASGSTEEVESLDARGAEASIKVAHTAELLEMILLDVDDMRTVLLSQRVSRTFKNTIQGSQKLLHKLWFKTDYIDENEYPDAFGCFASLPDAEDCRDVNPLLQKRTNTKEDRLVWFEDDSAGNNIIHIHRNALFEHKEESWRQMLIFSRECTEFEARVLFHWRFFKRHDTIDVRPTDTIEDLLDLVEEYYLVELEDEDDDCERVEDHKRWQAKLQSQKIIP